MSRVTLLALLATGCGYTAEEFQADYAEAHCAVYDQCALLGVSEIYTSLEDCVAQVEASVAVETCEFDRETAQECVDALNTMSCDDLYDDAWPGSCAAACP